MSQIKDIAQALYIFAQYGATTVEADHDAIFVTTTISMELSAQQLITRLGFDAQDADEDEIWWKKQL